MNFPRTSRPDPVRTLTHVTGPHYLPLTWNLGSTTYIVTVEHTLFLEGYGTKPRVPLSAAEEET